MAKNIANNEVLRSKPTEAPLSPRESQRALVESLTKRLVNLKNVPSPSAGTVAGEKYEWKEKNLTARLALAEKLQFDSPEKVNA